MWVVRLVDFNGGQLAGTGNGTLAVLFLLFLYRYFFLISHRNYPFHNLPNMCQSTRKIQRVIGRSDTSETCIKIPVHSTYIDR